MRTLPVIDESHASCVRLVPVFARLTPALQGAVAALAHPSRLARGDLLPRAASGSLYVVHTGLLRVEHVTASGRRRLLRVAGPGDVVGEHEFLTGDPPDYEIQAGEDAELCVFQRSGLTQLMAANPTLALEMLRAQSDQLAEAERRLAQAPLDVSQRVAEFLLDLPGTWSAAGLGVELPWPKKDVAAYLGTTPESLSRALARWEAQHAIAVSGAHITLLDPTALEDAAP